MNQCDGCRAGKPRVKLVDGEWVVSPDGETHIMGTAFVNPNGLVTTMGYPDLMGCERKRYTDTAKE